MAEYMTLGELRELLLSAIVESPLGEDTVVHLCRQEEEYHPIRWATLSRDEDGAVFLLSDQPETEGDLRDYRVTVIRRYERSYDIRASSEDQAEMLVLESPEEGIVHAELLGDEVTHVEEI